MTSVAEPHRAVGPLTRRDLQPENTTGSEKYVHAKSTNREFTDYYILDAVDHCKLRQNPAAGLKARYPVQVEEKTQHPRQKINKRISSQTYIQIFEHPVGCTAHYKCLHHKVKTLPDIKSRRHPRPL